MDITTFLMNGVDARIDDALFALSMVVVWQCVMIVYSHFSKHPFSVIPALESVLRPVAVFLIDKLNRPTRSELSLIVRGIIVFFLLGALALSIGVTVEFILYSIGYGGLMDIVLLFFVLSPIYPAYIGFKASKTNPPKKTFYYLSQGLNQNIAATDDSGQRRNGYRLMAVSLAEWLVIPIALYLLGGMGATYIYAALSLFVRVTGHGASAPLFLSVFGLVRWSLHFIVSIFNIVLLCVASVFAAGGRPLSTPKAFGSLAQGYGTLAAYAYGQNIALGGAFQDRQGHGAQHKWLGGEKSSAQLTHQDIIRGCFMHFIAVFLFWAMLFTAQVYS